MDSASFNASREKGASLLLRPEGLNKKQARCEQPGAATEQGRAEGKGASLLIGLGVGRDGLKQSPSAQEKQGPPSLIARGSFHK